MNKKYTITPFQFITETVKVVSLILIISILIKIEEKLISIKYITEHNYHISEFNIQDTKVTDMRITAYIPTSNKTALGDNVIAGRTAAVSSNCNYLLGEQVYIRGFGIRYVNDVTASWVDEEYDICTLDIAVPNKKEALKIGNGIHSVIRIDNDKRITN